LPDFVVIFTTSSDIEARIVRGLLDAHGVMTIVMSEPRGHSLPAGIENFAAEWIVRSLEAKPPEAKSSEKAPAKE